MSLKSLFALVAVFGIVSVNAGNLNVEKTAAAVSPDNKDAIFYINTDTGYAGSVTVRPEGATGVVKIVPHETEKGRYSLDIYSPSNQKTFAATVWVKK